jgi:hypothetical protein
MENAKKWIINKNISGESGFVYLISGLMESDKLNGN